MIKLSVSEITQAKVLEMVRNKEISLSKGAELLEMPLQSFLELASKNRISVLDYESEEVESNLSALRKAFTKIRVSE